MLSLEQIRHSWTIKKARKALLIQKNKGVDIESMLSFLDTIQPEWSDRADHCNYLVVDIETTGLSLSKDSILSIGYVAIRKGVIELDSAKHIYIQTEQSVGESATIHGIHDSDIQQKGKSITYAIDKLLTALSGHVLVVHYAKLDLAFLNKVIQARFGFQLLIPCLDTMAIERKRQLRKYPTIQPKLRLDDCRERYGLPRYSAHNALIDAIATAELWLAQLSHTQGNKQSLLKDFK